MKRHCQGKLHASINGGDIGICEAGADITRVNSRTLATCFELNLTHRCCVGPLERCGAGVNGAPNELHGLLAKGHALVHVQKAVLLGNFQLPISANCAEVQAEAGGMIRCLCEALLTSADMSLKLKTNILVNDDLIDYKVVAVMQRCNCCITVWGEMLLVIDRSQQPIKLPEAALRKELWGRIRWNSAKAAPVQDDGPVSRI